MDDNTSNILLKKNKYERFTYSFFIFRIIMYVALINYIIVRDLGALRSVYESANIQTWYMKILAPLVDLWTDHKHFFFAVLILAVLGIGYKLRPKIVGAQRLIETLLLIIVIGLIMIARTMFFDLWEMF